MGWLINVFWYLGTYLTLRSDPVIGGIFTYRICYTSKKQKAKKLRQFGNPGEAHKLPTKCKLSNAGTLQYLGG